MTPKEKEQVIASLHWLLARLHDSLAANRAPDPEIQEIAFSIADWWEEYKVIKERSA